MVGTKTKHARKRHKRDKTAAARADKRKRQPRRRNRAAYNRKIYRALNRDDCGDSRRKVTFESGFCVYRDFYARIYENYEDYCKNRYSKNPVSSPMTDSTKSLSENGRNKYFCLLLRYPSPKKPPLPNA